mmetsp:Transcript_11150/g.23948  ORF Transcript_11150/g.23948 Transcript_11150/m.23948 type:complete len:194 (-) Transcript_11150:1067-1648(-)
MVTTESCEARQLTGLVVGKDPVRKSEEIVCGRYFEVARKVTALIEQHLLSTPPDLVRMKLEPSFPTVESLFYSVSIQKFELVAYVEHLVGSFECSDAVCIHALAYLNHVRAENPRLAPNEYNIHRLLLTAVSLAIKFVEDFIIPSEFIARAGGLQSTSELATMERQFLKLIKYNCCVSLQTYNTIQDQLLHSL